MVEGEATAWGGLLPVLRMRTVGTGVFDANNHEAN